MKPHALTLATAAILLSAPVGHAQTPRSLPFAGSNWGYFYYERGNPPMFLGLGDSADNVARPPSGLECGLPEGVITIVTRDGAPVGEADRAAATAVAQEICLRNGRQFNRRSQGRFLRNGGLSFDGDCTRW